MNRYAILSKDGNTVENIILASHEYAEGKDMFCCDDMELGVGWVKQDGVFIDPTPIVLHTTINDYEEISLSDEEISNLLRLIQEDEARS